MPRAKRNPDQPSFLDNYGKTAPAVPAIKKEVLEWIDSGYKGATTTTRILLNYWFHTDHKLANGRPFCYHDAQQEAIQSLIYVFEIAQTRNMRDLFQRFIPAEVASQIRLPETDLFARYCTKMATGSGKTKVMSLAIAWQYFNAVCELNPDYARTFVIFAPNVIVFERLRTDFSGGRLFKEDPIIPRELQVYWDMQFYMRGEAERASSEGAVYLTNVQQIYDRSTESDDEPDIMTQVLGSKPPANLTEPDDFKARIFKRNIGKVLVLNDEAHHTHDPKSAWNGAIQALHGAHPHGIAAQLDFSATPRHNSGALFAWTISDYTIKQAIIQGIVKRPIKGITNITEAQSDVASTRYQGFITAGIERWREYRDALQPLEKKPLLFIMMNNTDEADSIGDYLRTKYPDQFGGERTLVIHVDRQGEVSKADLESARKAAREVDYGESPVNAIVSVLMLREGWDVQNVTVVVGLRPYTSKANILPEQTIGRGLRLMFRGLNTAYQERVDIIGNPGFIKFVEQLEKDEDIDFDTWNVGKDKLVIEVIQPVAEKAAFDVSLPILSPIYVRASSLQAEIEAIDINMISLPVTLPRKAGSEEEKRFRYEGKDIITLETLLEREYTIPTPQTSGEIISFYAQVIAQELKLPSQFHALAPKVRDFLKYRAFGEEVDLDTAAMLQAISRPITRKVTCDTFLRQLRPNLVQETQPVLETSGQAISSLPAFPWAQLAPVCAKTVLNKVPCDNQFEEDFARFLDKAFDVARFSKLPVSFGFSIPYTDSAGNLRHYYPDFVVEDTDGVHYIVETKGREDIDVRNKDRSAIRWAESATQLTDTQWEYCKVLQKEFQKMNATDFADCVYAGKMQGSLFEDDI